MTRNSVKYIAWLMVLVCSPIQALENPRQPILDLENQIEEMVQRHGPFSTELIEPSIELARLYIQTLDFELATDQLHRAQNIAHRNEGVYTPRQSEAVALLTEIALAEQDYRAANTQQKFSFFIKSHDLDPGDPDILFAYAEMADWYMFTGQTRRARRLLKEGIEEASNLGLDPTPLSIQLSKARRLEGVCCVSKQLLELLATRPETDPDTLAGAYLEIADTYILARKEDEAAEYFLKANEVSPLSVSVAPRLISMKRPLNDPQTQRVRIYSAERDMFDRLRLDRHTDEQILQDQAQEPQWFIVDDNGAHRGFTIPDSTSSITQVREEDALVGHPILFSEDQIRNLIPRQLGNNEEGFRIELSFTVTDEGDIEEIEIISSNSPVKLNRLVLEALRKAYYRPGLVDGVPVTTENVQLVQSFTTHYKGM